MTGAEIVLITIGGVTLVAVLMGLGLQIHNYWIARRQRRALEVVHLHHEQDDETAFDDNLEAVFGSVPAGYTRCRQQVGRVTSL